jgi:hypothetical protein
MATIQIRQTAWLGWTTAQRQGIQEVSDIALGDGGFSQDENGAFWRVHDDTRFQVVDLARLGCILANLGDYPDFDPPNVSDILAENIRFCDEHGLVWPVAGIENAENPFQFAFDAQPGAPSDTVVCSYGPLWEPWNE